MKMRIRTLILAVLVLGFAALPASAQKPSKKDLNAAIQLNAMRSSLFYKALSLAGEKKDVEYVLRTLEDGLSSKKAADVNIAALWLNDFTGPQHTQEHFNSFYLMFLADLKAKEAVSAQQVGKVKDAEAAAAAGLKALMAFEILANADAERCGAQNIVDQTRAAVDSLVLPRFRDLRFSLKKAISKEQYDRFAFEAIETESNKSARPGNLYLCKLAEAAATDPAYAMPAEESPNKAWNEKRHLLRGNYKTIWSNRYYKLREMK